MATAYNGGRMQTLTDLNSWLNGYVWGLPMIGLLIGTGLLLTVLTGVVQVRYLGYALKEVLGKLRQGGGGEGSVRPFQAVATALASTVGVGNIAGVATAISLGGPGALFWLWVSGVLGMCTKYAEIVVAIHYRERDASGVMRGGAMYILKNGLGMPWLGAIFALLTSLAAFGIGNMVQANSVADVLRTSLDVPTWMTGVGLVAVTALVILGGIKRIGQVTEYLVPFMAILYLVGGAAVLVRYAGLIPEAISLVFSSAFSGTAAVGGFAGSSVAMALRYGIARGLFSNEAGLGSAPMVHAAANTDHPVRQGMYGIFEVFVDTLLICTTTGLVILVTDSWSTGATGAAREVRAAAEQMQELPFYNTFFKTATPPTVMLATKLAELLGGDLQHVFFNSSGSEANDTVMRMVRHYWTVKGEPKRSVFISRWNAYHGSTMAGASLGGMKHMHPIGGLPIPGIEHVAQPYKFNEGFGEDEESFAARCAQELEGEVVLAAAAAWAVPAGVLYGIGCLVALRRRRAQFNQTQTQQVIETAEGNTRLSGHVAHLRFAAAPVDKKQQGSMALAHAAPRRRQLGQARTGLGWNQVGVQSGLHL